ncbi:hypothetical protein C8A03DRAFT_36794 [Achaetomium macrosporum]|uniref:Protein NO VEIN C-terminal domain-containing protein n=1 Tax=Achaetomium macrosporum TaxID=79813 RepID=A0AAN7C5F5_9PEZI|nr:hypothetical protein C8A03DRAFT_36794 [Achaetomium macrosporum]
MSSTDEAREAVMAIAKRNGFVKAEVWDRLESWDPDTRRELEEAIRTLSSTAAHSIKTLAKNIYGSGARFVFELLQNADDNRFTRARETGALPYFAFAVHPRHIIVECNEDGFTKNDLEAICTVGRSTKSANYGYIGAKGIGFKSVFIAAWKVHIQSGHFSFYFKHDKGDPGLGMVTPIWEDGAEELPSPLTRMTLYLHDKGDPSELEHLRSIISEQLSALQPTCLLFLRNLKQIRVTFYGEDGQLKRARQFRLGDGIDHHSVFLETVITNGRGEETTEKRHYHVTRHLARNLARSENRDLPGAENHPESSSRAEVVLAFPLTEYSQPIIERQEVFAFLPLRESPFKFLIHSDFDTTASRQDINTTSKRNTDLLKGIAAAFVTAVQEFCEHGALCYSWPEFLPGPDDTGVFWSELIEMIKTRLRATPVLRSRHRSDLRKIRDVVILPQWARDQRGEPLMDDRDRDPFLSDGYRSKFYTPLRQYGLQPMGMDMFLDLLAADLQRPDSRMKSASTNQEWHYAVAQALSTCFTKNWPASVERLKSMPLLPLRHGSWVTARDRRFYLPETKGIPIPPGVDFNVLDPAAVANAKRKQLFLLLGARKAKVARVRASVLANYQSSDAQVDIVTSKAHLDFLYLTHDPNEDPNQVRDELRQVYLHTDTRGIVRNPRDEDLYLPLGHRYGPEALLQRTAEAPGLPVLFVNTAYLVDLPYLPPPPHPTWLVWLCDFVGFRERLRLVSPAGDALSETVSYVATHRPKEFLGLLKYLWQYEGSDISSSVILKRELSGISAELLCGGEARFPGLPLHETWLPIQDLKQERWRYMKDTEPFPFLDLGETTSEEELNTQWMFLHWHLSVGKDDNLKFFLDIAFWINNASPGSPPASASQRMLDLYTMIDAKYQVATDQQSARNLIRKYFWDNITNVFIPANDRKEAQWAQVDECLWDAPACIVLKHPLLHLYGNALGTPPDQMERLAHLFRNLLSVPDASWKDITAELEHLKVNNCDDLDCIRDLYCYLNRMEVVAFAEELSQDFEDKGLILAVKNGQTGWYKTSECLWSSTTTIRGKVTLNDEYEELRDFFVDRLGVRTLTLQMVFDELLRTTPGTPVDEVKHTLWSFNALLQIEPDRPSPKRLLRARIFPVRCGDDAPVLKSTRTDFALIDREHLAEKFWGKINVLDFTLEQVRQLQPFIEWAGLQPRYLSAAVKQITSRPPEGGRTRPISVPERNLKGKAHALLRIAKMFNSPRYQADPAALYRLLRAAGVLETDGIHSALTISQNGKAIEVLEEDGDQVHIEDDPSSGLKLYVPMDETSQDVCFASSLPLRLADWLMRDPDTQIPERVCEDALVTSLTALLGARLSAVDRILDLQGIVRVDIPDESDSVGNDSSVDGNDVVNEEYSANEDAVEEDAVDEEDSLDEEDAVGEDAVEEVAAEEEAAEEDAVAEDAANEDVIDEDATSIDENEALEDDQRPETHGSIITGSPSNGGGMTPATSGFRETPTPYLGSDDLDAPVEQIVAQPTYTAAHASMSAVPLLHRAPHPHEQLPGEDRHYRRLLDRVVAAARNATLPRQGAFAMDSLRNALPRDEIISFDGLDAMSRFRSSSQLERDKKIGAAGELYAFELLSGLDPALPAWSRANWQSTIRKYTTIHPDYSDMEPWERRETADIVYEDVESVLTEWLIDCGYLDRAHWQDARPRYYIEVKTTTGPSVTPFYMSRRQFELMRAVHSDAEERSRVYMIFRVYGLESERIGMHVYLDPEYLRLDGQLVFTGEVWSVTPGSGQL